MKALMLSLVISLTAFSSVASGINNIEIPEAVIKEFEKRHPNAVNPFWEMRESLLVATFQTQEGLTKAFFNEVGQWKETRIRIDRQVLPNPINQFLLTYFEDANITYIGKLIKPNVDKELYRIESEREKEVVIKILDEKARLMEEQRIEFTFPIY